MADCGWDHRIYDLPAGYSRRKYKQVATVKSAQTLFYTDQKLAAGKTYKYKVCAYKTYKDKNYKGAYSTESR